MENAHRFICSGELNTFREIVTQWLGLELAHQAVVYEQAEAVQTNVLLKD